MSDTHDPRTSAADPARVEDATSDPSTSDAIDAASHEGVVGAASVTRTLDPRDAGEPPPPALPQARIGRYVVVDVLGAGGFGTVYRAYDPQLDRFVALKIVRLAGGHAHDAEEGRARALREAQTLAKFDHPNVVPVFDAGVVGDDVYIAMALVEGETLAAWLASSPRSPRAILDAYVAAGRGLEAAHRAGMVHRDFKPENVFVTAEGSVRVLDFGLARIIDADLAPELVTGPGQPPIRSAPAYVSRAGRRVGTPAYMAPEQHRGEACDARSDQFSFCVAVYRALTGEHPFAGMSSDELAASIVSGVVRPFAASARVAPHVQKALMRGLSASRDARFPAMGELLHELSRDPSRTLRRVLGAVAFAAAVAGVSVVAAHRVAARPPPCSATASIADSWNEAAKERIRAAFAASGRAYSADSFERVRSRLDAYASSLGRERVGLCEEERRVGGSPLIEDKKQCLEERSRELSYIAMALGRPAAPTMIDSAITAVDRLTFVDECRAPDKSVFHIPQPADPVLRERVGLLAARLSEIRIQDDLAAEPHLDESRALLAEARSTEYARLIAVAAANLRRGLTRVGKRDEAVGVAREAVSAAARAHWTTGWLSSTGSVALALALARKAGDAKVYVPILEGLVQLQSEDPRGEAGVLGDLAQVEAVLGDKARAAQHAMDAAAIYARLVPAASAASLYLKGFAAHQLTEGNRVAEAAAVLADAVPGTERALGPHHPHLASALYSGALLDACMWNFADAHAGAARARAIYADLASDHFALADTLEVDGIASWMDGDPASALASLERALALRESRFGPANPLVGTVTENLALAHADAGNLSDAIRFSERSVAIFRGAFGEDHADLDYVIENDALMRIRRGQLDLARRALTGTLATRRARGSDRILLTPALSRLSQVEVRQGRVASARALADEALADFANAQPVPGDMVESVLAHSDAALAGNDPSSAAGSLERALAVLEPIARPAHPLLARVRARLGDIRLSTGDAAGAIPLYDAAISALTGATHDPIDLLTARFGHARAVWTLDPARHPEARAEAREVLAGASVKEVMLPDLRRAVAAWLTAHP